VAMNALAANQVVFATLTIASLANNA